MKIVVTGATGKLGRLVVEGLLKKVPASQLVLAVRSPDKATVLAALGAEVREADYTRPETLKAALAGTQKLLLISSSAMADRFAHHKVVIDAAKRAGVRLVVYTSLLHADKSGLALAAEHKATEQYLRASGIPYVILRNGWYTENFTENITSVLENGALVGSARDGRVAAASRADYAAAAVEVLTGKGHENKVYELAGDKPFSMSDLAAEISLRSGKTIAYEDLSHDEHNEMLLAFGVPEPLADLLVDADHAISRGELNDASGELHRLIGRPTTPLAEAVAHALGAAPA